ncbi:hypothetical protein L861_20970 [Litchfieldella anticariensis FP35 = DSM 16096]|uniref:Pilus assembly protein PilP n=1 Tax=Litchfieldella anticariensis (strain DSM 16096 / CECT 5854 / CIP 108499 / LMG 22089 / FP35) TaxID=1121939 RepID=S2LAG3_LITA3|nr:pilus assembly protein PilP [Halomonas anticariensis]EPC01701.1 hypothetical protein L861_20970 [Halomonas anticariensis FP35 = DSM 16096]
MTPRRGWMMRLVVALMLSGCADPGIEQLDRELAMLRADPNAEELPTLPELPDVGRVAYEHADVRSPFLMRRPDNEEVPRGSIELAPDLSRPKEPLEAYLLESLDLVGTLSVGGRYSALVRAPDGQVHRLATGDHLGTDFGRIVSIGSDSVRVLEVIATGHGGWIERSRHLTLDNEYDRRG